ncbi:MAG TPA: AtpZ/AtpI family protein [Sphingomicrobium sp.]|nr:AtpZ/AtpI family protein [Sphingomicrobium sp.]
MAVLVFRHVPRPWLAPGEMPRGDAQGRDMADDDTDEVPKLSPDARLESLDQRLDRLQQAEAKRTAKRQPDQSYQAGQLVLSQLVGCPLGGGIVGWLLDHWLGTRPWLMLVMLFVGFAVGIWNVIRISNNSRSSAPIERE